MIRFFCECGRQLQAAEQYIGQPAACPMCNRTTIVPPSDQGRPSEPRPARGRVNDHGEITRPPTEPAPRPRARSYEDRPPAATASSGMATASMLFGLLSFPCLFGLLAGLPAIVTGILALRNPRVQSGELTGKGNAIAGIVLGCLGLLLLAPLYLAVGRVRTAAERQTEANNLKQIGIAMHSHHDATGTLPAATAFRTKDGKPGLSWRVALLPYIEQDTLYRQFKLDEPWDSPNNIRLLPMIPKVYLQPGENNLGTGMTHYQAFVGPGTAFEDMNQQDNFNFMGGFPRRGTRITEFTDGTSNTILVAAARNPVPWTKPDDLVFDPNQPLPPLLEKSGGTQVALADGSVRWLPINLNQAMLRAMVTRNGGEVVNWP